MSSRAVQWVFIFGLAVVNALTLPSNGHADDIKGFVYPDNLLKAGNIGELIYPDKKIGENINRMETALKEVIGEFGSTFDAGTLAALQRALAAIQSLRLAYADSLSATTEAVDEQRKKLLYDVGNKVLLLKDSLAQGGRTASDIEAGFSESIERATRASRSPWMSRYEPQQFRSDLSSPLAIRISGRHLDDPSVRLIVSGQEFKAASNSANQVIFNIPRVKLIADNDGLISLKLRAAGPDDSWFSWLPGHTPPEPIEYSLVLRKLGEKVGSYTVTTHVATGPNHEVNTRDIHWKLPSDSQVIRVVPLGSPELEGISEQCVEPKDFDGTEFDTSFTDSSFPPSGAVFDGSAPLTNKPSRIYLNAPEKICVQFKQSEIARLRVRVRLSPKDSRFERVGTLIWSKDEPIQLPIGFQGWQVAFSFTDAERDRERTFTSVTTYGPLSILFDQESRTIVLRAYYLD